MGYTYNDFWDMNPRILEVIAEGYKLNRKVKDEDQWLLGGYIFEAVTIAVGNMFKKKGQKAQSYFDVVKKPVLGSVQENGEMSEEEKQKKIELLLAGLRTKQANFELSKQKEGQ